MFSRRFVPNVIGAACVVVGLAACGDKEAAIPATTVAASTTVAATTVAPTTVSATTVPPATDVPATDVPVATDGGGPPDTVLITSIDELPPECLTLTDQQLAVTEKSLESVDVATMTFGQFFDVGNAFQDAGAEIDAVLDEKCDSFNFDDENSGVGLLAGYAKGKGFAKSAEFFQLAVDYVAATLSGAPAEPCDKILTTINDAMATAPSIVDLAVPQAVAVSKAIVALTSACTPEQYAALDTDPKFTAFVASMDSLGG
jgi:hypothetical protein